MSAALLKRADEAKARNKMMESIPGTGFHPEDRDHRGRHRAPEKNGLPPVRDHAIAFHGEDGVRFVGPDAERIGSALKKYNEALRASDVASLDGVARQLLRVLPRLAVAKAADGTPTLHVPQGPWNDVLFAIYESGIGLTGQALDA